jgi:putative Holliday junction resolvase
MVLRGPVQSKVIGRVPDPSFRLKGGSRRDNGFGEIRHFCRLLKDNVLPDSDSYRNAERSAEGAAHIIGAVDFEPRKQVPDDTEEATSRGGSGREVPVGRVLGLDVGSRRIGVAVSDPLGITAQGLDTLQRTTKRRDFDHLQRVIQEYDVREIVVGLPLRMSGAEGIQSDKMQVFAEELRKRFRLPVHLWDERLTSVEANRLLREADLSIEKRGKAVDRMAAILILQGWMENRASGPRS